MAETITAIAALLWPLLLLVVLLMFRRPLGRVVRSAEHREWTLEVGGQKLSMKQLSDQQNSMIADLQKQVGVLSQTLATLSPDHDVEPADEDLFGSVETQTRRRHAASPPAHSVLWVDDHPENNALFVEQLQRNGVRVDPARSTDEGLALFGQRRYAIVVSDMGRTENATNLPDAGLRLLAAIRRTDHDVAFVIYCSSQAARVYREQALAAGATAITASPVVLSEHLHVLDLL